MRRLHTILILSTFVLLAGSAMATDAQIITGSGGTVTTAPSGTTGVAVTTVSDYPFHVFNSSNVELLRIQSNGNVGIGTAPSALLHLKGAGSATTTGFSNISAGSILLENTDGATTGSTVGVFGTPAVSGLYSGIGFIRESASTWGSALAFYTHPVGQTNFAGLTERMRLDSSGNVKIIGGPYDPSDYARLGFSSSGYYNGAYPTLAQVAARFTTFGSYLEFGTSNQYVNGIMNTAMTIDYYGNVGIGTTAPTALLEIGSSYPTKFLALYSQGTPNGYLLEMAGNSQIHVAGLEIGSAGVPVVQTANGYPLYLNSQTGNDVIVGRDNDAHGLKVLGTGVSSFVGGDVTMAHNLTVTGSITGASVIHATYQDVAEWVPATTTMDPGTVVVLNRERDNEVTLSQHAYDTAVAGVVSEHPGLILGVPSESKAQIATTGRVKVHVDARNHPVAIGDLLVTSDVPGTAMVSQPIDVAGVKIHRPGTLIGKALEPLTGGTGEILVLLSLQ